jgi:hypothetical protein
MRVLLSVALTFAAGAADAVVLTRDVTPLSTFIFDDRTELQQRCPWPVRATYGDREIDYCPDASAFFTGFRSNKDPSRVTSLLVTARHVAHEAFVPRGADGKGRLRLFARFTIAGPQQMTWLRPADWICPTDPSYDVAVHLGTLPKTVEAGQSTAEYADESFIRQEGIVAGDQIITVAMVPALAGAKRNFPIARQGILALLDPAPDSPGRGINYFAEANSYPGNSGAPVYLMLTGLRGRTIRLGEQLHLIGVNHGYIGQPSPGGLDLQNIGLQAFTRVDILLKVLCSDATRAYFDRADVDRNICERIPATPTVEAKLGECP